MSSHTFLLSVCVCESLLNSFSCHLPLSPAEHSALLFVVAAAQSPEKQDQFEVNVYTYSSVIILRASRCRRQRIALFVSARMLHALPFRAVIV
jgi:hypothetical protein